MWNCFLLLLFAYSFSWLPFALGFSLPFFASNLFSWSCFLVSLQWCGLPKAAAPSHGCCPLGVSLYWFGSPIATVPHSSHDVMGPPRLQPLRGVPILAWVLTATAPWCALAPFCHWDLAPDVHLQPPAVPSLISH